jgi:hypothetical protein
MGLEIAIVVGTTAAPDLANADRVEVYERIGEATTYRLRYALAEADEDFAQLTDSRLDVGGTLTVAVPAPEDPEVLVKGQVYGQHIHFKHGVQGSYVDVLGGDLTLEMDRDISAKIWPASGAISDAVSSIIGGYPQVTPDVEALSVATDEGNHLLVQRDTDLRFLRRLARRYGYWFWVTTDTSYTTTAHWKRPPLDGDPVAALTLNAKDNNVASLDLDWDVERPNTAVATQLGLRDKESIDGAIESTPLTLLGSVGLADVAAARGIQIVAPADVAGDLQKRSEAALIESGWFIRARGQTSMRQLGKVLHTHTLVSVNGIGTRHSGTYVVAAVRHIIDSIAHVMEFELVRNAWEA